MNYSYVPINAIFSKLVRDVTKTFSERDVIEWTAEALEAIGAVQAYEEAIAFIEVKNHQCTLPAGIHSIIQIARNANWSAATCNTNAFCPTTVASELCTTDMESCPECAECVSDLAPQHIFLDCNGMPLNDYDVAYYRPYFDLQYEYYNWRNSSMYKRCYTPVRLATHTFFDSLVCTTDDQNDPVYDSIQDEYTIIQKKVLRFSFKEGSVAVAYNRQVVDSATGYPMIPDTYSNKQAIVKYITWMLLSRDCYNGREAACGKADKAEAQWQWYCGQASNADKMPYGIDEYQNLLDQRSYMLPRTGHYFGFFGAMANPEMRKWNDPDRRNSKIGYFIGN